MPQSTPEIVAYRVDELEKHVAERDKELEKQLAERDKEFEEFKEALAAERTKYLFWGITMLGAAVCGLVGLIWQLLTGGHLK
jgi:hypothetical protein